MSREDTKKTERQVIRQCLASHPTLLLKGPAQTSVRRTLEALVELHSDDEVASSALEDRHPDVVVYNAKELKTADAREIRQDLSAHPARWTCRYFILSQIDRLHNIAAQTLLKLIEEPPEFLRIILATDRPAALPNTVRSRAIQINISRPPENEIVEILKERGLDEPVWRARFAAGDLSIAEELDTKETQEWQKVLASVLSGAAPPPAFPYVWNERFKEMGEATRIACWDVLVNTASRRPLDRFWRRAGLRAVKERERVRRGKTNKIFTGTALVDIYANLKTTV